VVELNTIVLGTTIGTTSDDGTLDATIAEDRFCNDQVNERVDLGSKSRVTPRARLASCPDIPTDCDKDALMVLQQIVVVSTKLLAKIFKGMKFPVKEDVTQ
jgi:hypothetical protein